MQSSILAHERSYSRPSHQGSLCVSFSTVTRLGGASHSTFALFHAPTGLPNSSVHGSQLGSNATYNSPAAVITIESTTNQVKALYVESAIKVKYIVTSGSVRETRLLHVIFTDPNSLAQLLTLLPTNWEVKQGRILGQPSAAQVSPPASQVASTQVERDPHPVAVRSPFAVGPVPALAATRLGPRLATWTNTLDLSDRTEPLLWDLSTQQTEPEPDTQLEEDEGRCQPGDSGGVDLMALGDNHFRAAVDGFLSEPGFADLVERVRGVIQR